MIVEQTAWKTTAGGDSAVGSLKEPEENVLAPDLLAICASPSYLVLFFIWHFHSG
jgi:hypothetical protein